MNFFKSIATATLVTLSLAGTAQAQDAKAIEGAIKARQSQMTLFGFNLGLLGGMAKGDIAYDAESAGKAAAGLAALVQLDGSRMWLPGSDNVSAKNTRALPAIWQSGSDVGAKLAALGAAADGMAAAAGTDLEALRGAMGPLGGACGACHKAYRAPEN